MQNSAVKHNLKKYLCFVSSRYQIANQFSCHQSHTNGYGYATSGN